MKTLVLFNGILKNLSTGYVKIICLLGDHQDQCYFGLIFNWNFLVEILRKWCDRVLIFAIDVEMFIIELDRKNIFLFFCLTPWFKFLSMIKFLRPKTMMTLGGISLLRRVTGVSLHHIEGYFSILMALQWLNLGFVTH